jgi:hypothetical protein
VLPPDPAEMLELEDDHAEDREEEQALRHGDRIASFSRACNRPNGPNLPGRGTHLSAAGPRASAPAGPSDPQADQKTFQDLGRVQVLTRDLAGCLAV